MLDEQIAEDDDVDDPNTNRLEYSIKTLLARMRIWTNFQPKRKNYLNHS